MVDRRIDVSITYETVYLIVLDSWDNPQAKRNNEILNFIAQEMKRFPPKPAWNSPVCLVV